MMDSGSVVFVVDDDAAMRDAISSLLRSIGLNVALFASAMDFLSFQRPDLASYLVLDVRLPGRSGLDLQRDLRSAGESIPVIFITGHGDIPMSVRAMKAGAMEFLPKPFREQDLLDAVILALARDAEARTRRAEIAGIRKGLERLTARERQVMEGLLVGMLNKQVAATLGISEVTVKLHRRRVLEKMSASSLVRLLARTTALERVSAFLLAMAGRAASSQDDPIALPMSRYDIADYLALSVETVSRALTALRHRRVIALTGARRVNIVDRGQLQWCSENSGL